MPNALKLAIECGAEVTRPLAPHEFSVHAYVFGEQQLETFYAKAQAQALRELVRDIVWPSKEAYDAAVPLILNRVAELERKA